jgi:lipoprotein-anchoring transpeptidase ErfK/SrfK
VTTRQAPALAMLGVLAALQAGCDDFSHPARGGGDAGAAAPAAPAPSPAAAESTAPQAVNMPIAAAEATPPASAPSAAPDAVDSAAPSPASTAALAAPIESSRLAESSGAAGRPVVIKLEVLLDRAHFSPGVIDGRPGGNLRAAIAAYQKARGLPADGKVHAAMAQALEAADPGPVTQDYTITAADEKGPFVGELPVGFEKLAALEHLGYSTPLESLAEKFHMSQALLRELNPRADFAAVGSTLLVVRPGTGRLDSPVAQVEVDKAQGQVRALDGRGKVLAVYPATVGSTERPAPSGKWAVKSVVQNPDYSYDPKRLTFGDKAMGALRIAPGPNNPVGSTWIALTVPTYGIHGAPDPTKVGKTASHGCVRLTNWDAAGLGRSVSKGTPVVFVGRTSKS